MGFKRNADNPIAAKAIVIDEASMLDLFRAYSLVKAIPSDAQLLLVGDIDQLPSVGPGNVLRDLIIETLTSQPLEVREAVEEVSIDMWAGFPIVVEKLFPNAVIVIDFFHVMKLANKGLNKIFQQLGVKPKQGKYLLLKNASDLKKEEQVKLAKILSRSACLRIAYEMKEEFPQIYETSQAVKSGFKRMSKWLAQAYIFYGKAVQTIRAHLPEICNYFISRTTSGVMEGINNKIKLILRQGYGFSNFDNFRLRLLASFPD